MNAGLTWAIVLAAGEGSRLRSVTTISTGISVPKQFCSLRGGMSLLHEALQRAEAITPRERICTVVAQSHRHWWQSALHSRPKSNVIVQPQNRGTAVGILLPLLHIMQRDPEANIVLLPSDHHVRDESVLAAVMQSAVLRLKCIRQIVLLGIEPDEADPDLGYIVPEEIQKTGLSAVARFVEKPSVHEAQALLQRGALWNSFIIATRARALLDAFTLKYPQLVKRMQDIVAHDHLDPGTPAAAMQVYGSLPQLDFSKDVLQGFEPILRVLMVPRCGWSDLGTPKRVEQTLQRISARSPLDYESNFPLRGQLNLAEQFPRTQASL